MTDAPPKPFISPATQAKLLRLRIKLIGLARDYWKDAPMPWPPWALRLKGRLLATLKSRPSAPKVAAKPKKAAHAASHQDAAAQQPEEKVITPWSVTDRLQVLEAMWGEGHVFPGDEEYIRSLINPLAITQDHSVLDLSAGLGDLARQVVEEHKAYVTGMEMDQVVAARGMVMSIAAGKSKTASIVGYDPVTYTAARKYDCVFARELFYRIIGKEKFFKAVDSSIKTGGGQICFTDYVLDPTARQHPAVAKWLEVERGAAPLSSIETIKTWKGMGYDIRVAEDQTKIYRNTILKGLHKLAEHLASSSLDHLTKQLVTREIGLWGCRLAALDQGLKYYRFLGIKY